MLGTLGRHQLGALAATAVDFSLMTALVALGHVPPAAATLFGALAGGVTNYSLGRRWIFAAQEEPAGPQALRYALVSGGSAALNAGGEYLLHDVFGAGWLGARLLVSLLVSLAYNYPLQRRFVFRRVHA